MILKTNKKIKDRPKLRFKEDGKGLYILLDNIRLIIFKKFDLMALLAGKS
jgi:hypothetical protein